MSMNRKKNILFFSHTAQVSGAEMCLYELLKGLGRSHYGGLVIVPNDQPLKARIEAIGWPTHTFYIPWWVGLGRRHRWHLQDLLLGMPVRLKALREIAQKYQIDLVYTNTIVTLDGAALAKSMGLPHIWHIHELPKVQRFLKFYLPTSLLPIIVHWLSTAIVVPSAVAKRNIQWHNGKRIQIVNNGVDIPPSKKIDSHLFRQSLGIDPLKKIVAIVGSLNPNKGITDFVKAARLVRQAFKDVTFIIVGAGNRQYTQVVKETIAAEMMGGDVLLTGFRSDMDVVLHSIDILVSASRSECFPMTILEAMAAGKPVIATMSGGAQEQVVHSETGLLVPYADPQQLGHAMITLLTNDTMAKEMGRKAVERVRARFLKSNYVEGIRKVIDTCVTT